MAQKDIFIVLLYNGFNDTSTGIFNLFMKNAYEDLLVVMVVFVCFIE